MCYHMIECDMQIGQERPSVVASAPYRISHPLHRVKEVPPPSIIRSLLFPASYETDVALVSWLRRDSPFWV